MHSFPAGAVPIVPKNGRSGTSTLPILLLGMSRVATLRFLSRCHTNSRSRGRRGHHRGLVLRRQQPETRNRRAPAPIAIGLDAIDMDHQRVAWFGPLHVRSAQVRGHSILLLMIIRLAWRWAHPAPALPDHIPVAQRRAAVAMHWGLYALLLVQTLIGWNRHCSLSGSRSIPRSIRISSNLVGGPPAFRSALRSTFLDRHSDGGTVGRTYRRLYHHFVRQDEVLQRMLRGEVA